MEPEPETETIDEQEEPDDVVRIKYSWIRNAVAAAAIVVAIIILALPSGKTDMMSRSISNLNNGLFFGLNSKDTNTSKIEIKRNVESEKPVKSVVDSAANSNPLPSPTIDLPQKAYCIVLASDVSQKNAEAFVERLQKKGLEHVSIMQGKIRRVVIDGFATENEAYNRNAEIHRMGGDFAYSWVMKH